MPRRHDFTLLGQTIQPGHCLDLELPATESFTGVPVVIPLRVCRGPRPGPTIFISGAVHGDEVNGTGIVREIIINQPFTLQAGTLILVPVVNILGFERHTRYLPDRRDLNRSFPGSPDGSLASRFAYAFLNEIVRHCDFGVDLHSGALRRTNFPNIRGDLTNPHVARIAFAAGSQIVVNSRGPQGSLRRTACEAGHPTIVVEAGEIWKVEPGIVECGVLYVRNILVELGMVDGPPSPPAYQVQVNKARWVRAHSAGMLQFHVAPGELVHKDQPIASSTSLLGAGEETIVSPLEGVIMGLTTLPAVVPGDPICHIAVPKGGIKPLLTKTGTLDKQGLHQRIRDDLATNITVAEPNDDPEDNPDHRSA